MVSCQAIGQKSFPIPYAPHELGIPLDVITDPDGEKAAVRMAPGKRLNGEIHVEHLGWVTAACVENPGESQPVVVPPETTTVGNAPWMAPNRQNF